MNHIVLSYLREISSHIGKTQNSTKTIQLGSSDDFENFEHCNFHNIFMELMIPEAPLFFFKNLGKHFWLFFIFNSKTMAHDGGRWT